MSLRRLIPVIIFLICCLASGVWGGAGQAWAGAAGGQAGHRDPYTLVFFVFGLAIIVAALGRFAAARLKQSSVLGEVAAGILVGALLYQVGSPVIVLVRHADEVHQITRAVVHDNQGWQDAVRGCLEKNPMPPEDAAQLEKTLLRGDITQYYTAAEALQFFSSLGVVLLLFLVGLECNLAEMRRVGGPAVTVAVLAIGGIAVGAYLALTRFLLPAAGSLTALFMAAALTATSIGIAARVFRDMNALGLNEAKLVLGAAVVDDVLGLVLLAVVSGIAVEGSINFPTVGLILLKAVAFLGGVILMGVFLLSRLAGVFRVLDRGNVRLIFPFVLLLVLTWLAEEFGLAAIIGAFGAGLILEEKCFPDDPDCHFGGRPVETVVAPIQLLFAPIFFVLIGFKVDLGAFADVTVLLTSLALILIVAAGKFLATLSLRKGINKLIVAAGMLPGGEVMLIFASIGKSLGLLDDKLYAMIIIVMLANTLIAPSLLKVVLERQPRPKPA